MVLIGSDIEEFDPDFGSELEAQKLWRNPHGRAHGFLVVPGGRTVEGEVGEFRHLLNVNNEQAEGSGGMQTHINRWRNCWLLQCKRLLVSSKGNITKTGFLQSCEVNQSAKVEA